MKVYHVETKEDYDALMVELEEKGYKWLSGCKPTHFDGFKEYGKDACAYEEDGEITLSGAEYFKEYHSNETLIEYKAKGEKMKNLIDEVQEVLNINVTSYRISKITGITEHVLSKYQKGTYKIKNMSLETADKLISNRSEIEKYEK